MFIKKEVGNVPINRLRCQAMLWCRKLIASTSKKGKCEHYRAFRRGAIVPVPVRNALSSIRNASSYTREAIGAQRRNVNDYSMVVGV
jgi:hypothetical protein